MPSYQSRDSLVLGRQLRTQSLSLPFVIVGNAVAASVSITEDDPSILFLATAGVDQITGALASGETSPTYTKTDASGLFGALVAVQEVLVKVIDARIVSRTGQHVCYAYLPSAPSTGITAGTGGGSKIALQCKVPTDFTGANTFDGVLIVEYQVTE